MYVPVQGVETVHTSAGGRETVRTSIGGRETVRTSVGGRGGRLPRGCRPSVDSASCW